MNTKILKVVGLSAVIAVMLLSVGCVETVKVGELQTESQQVELSSAESVSTRINIGAGKLKVTGGADKLLESDFSYNIAAWKPEVKYIVNHSLGRLTVQQPPLEGVFPVAKIRNEWDLRLNNDVPMNLSVDMGAGDCDLDLGSLSLTKLDIDTGAGNVTVDLAGSRSLSRLNLDMGVGAANVDLSGNWKHDLDASIDGGVGEADLVASQ